MWTETWYLFEINTANIGANLRYLGHFTNKLIKYKHSIESIATTLGYRQSNSQCLQLYRQITCKLVAGLIFEEKKELPSLKRITSNLLLFLSSNRNQLERWRSCDCFIWNGKSCWYITISWWNEICSRKLVRCSIGWTNWQKWWNRWWCSVRLIVFAFIVFRLFSWILLLLGISIVHQIMVYLFLWRKYHCLHWHVNRVCRVPVPRNHLLQSVQWVHWAALRQQIRLVCEWALRYRSPPIALFTVHTERHRNYSITSIISLFVYCFDCIFAN